MKVSSLVCALSLSACTLGGQYPPGLSQGVQTYTVSPDVLASIDAAIATPPGLTSPPPAPLAVPEPMPPPEPAPLPAPKPGAKARPVAPVSPPQLVRAAHRAAQVEPSPRGYHAATNTMRFDWQPGKLYKIYVTPGQGTSIVLPPGFHLINEVLLEAEQWKVQSYRVGPEERTQDVLVVMPLPQKGATNVDLALLTEEGRSFDVSLIVGTFGMFRVTWNPPAVPQPVLDELPVRMAR